MPPDANALDAAHRDLAAGLDRARREVDRATDDAALLAVRDLLLDYQFESRGLITAIEERLGAFAGADDPRALAAEAEALIEQIEGLQDAWATRVDLLLDGGFDNDRIHDFLADALGSREGRAFLVDVFAGLPADMDQAAVLLDYAKRYLLSLAEPPPRGGRR